MGHVSELGGAEFILPDASFLQAAQQGLAGDEAALNSALQFIRGRLQPFLLSRVGDATLSEDLLQEALLHTLRALGAANAASGPQLLRWCYVTAQNVLRDSWRSRRCDPLSCAESLDNWPGVTSSEMPLPKSPVQSSVVSLCVRGAVAQLATEHQVLLGRVRKGVRRTVQTS